MSAAGPEASFEAFEAAVAGPGCRDVLSRAGRPYHLLTARQLARTQVDALCATATAVRRLDRDRAGAAFLRERLLGKRVMHLFAQPSTRTCESFVAAAEKVGAATRVVTDLGASSFSKGESVEDGVRTLATFFDALVVRHPDDRFALRAAWAMSRSPWPMPVISAGSGTREHPTQALLDVYTLREHLAPRGGLDGKRLLLAGDIGRNRTARSLLWLLGEYDIAGIDLVCHPAHPVEPAVLDPLVRRGAVVRTHRAIGDAVRAAGADLDGIYVTRLQQEWDERGAPLGTDPAFVLDPALRSAVRPDCAVLHPLPRVNELPAAWDEHPAFLVWRQVRNGLWVRAALLATIHGAAEGIVERAAGITGSGRT